jgi:hypothetical protein
MRECVSGGSHYGPCDCDGGQAVDGSTDTGAGSRDATRELGPDNDAVGGNDASPEAITETGGFFDSSDASSAQDTELDVAEPCPDPYENNDDAGHAALVPLTDGQGAIDALITGPDPDWFRFDFAPQARVQVSVDMADSSLYRYLTVVMTDDTGHFIGSTTTTPTHRGTVVGASPSGSFRLHLEVTGANGCFPYHLEVGPPFCADDHEPNNAPIQPTPLAEGTTLQGSVTAGDIDFYELRGLTSSGVCTVTPDNVVPGVDLAVFMVSANTNPLRDGIGQNTIAVPWTPGTSPLDGTPQYATVQAVTTEPARVSPTACISYSIVCHNSPSAPDAGAPVFVCADASEPNNSFGTATPLAIDATLHAAVGDHDLDMYALESAGRSGYCEMTPEGPSAPGWTGQLVIASTLGQTIHLGFASSNSSSRVIWQPEDGIAGFVYIDMTGGSACFGYSIVCHNGSPPDLPADGSAVEGGSSADRSVSADANDASAEASVVDAAGSDSSSGPSYYICHDPFTNAVLNPQTNTSPAQAIPLPFDGTAAYATTSAGQPNYYRIDNPLGQAGSCHVSPGYSPLPAPEHSSGASLFVSSATGVGLGSDFSFPSNWSAGAVAVSFPSSYTVIYVGVYAGWAMYCSSFQVYCMPN